MKKIDVRVITQCAVFVALMAVASQIYVPTPVVPITLQCFVISTCGYYLGLKRGLISVGVYLLLGIIGVPVFSGFGGGLYALLGPSGGFIMGFLPLCALCAIAFDKWQGILLGILGVLICHAAGSLWYSYVGGVDVLSAFVSVSLPFLLKDVILLVASYFLARLLRKRISRRA